MKKHTKKELKEMINEWFGSSHEGEKIIDIYSFITASGRECIKVLSLAPDTHTVYKETFEYNFSLNVVTFIRIDGIL